MKAPLLGALWALRPDDWESLLLRSCLASGEDCRAAWADFQGSGRELAELFRTDRGELKRLAPLLAHNLGRNEAPIEARVATVLRTGLLREELRSRIYGDVLEEALGALDAAGARYLVIGGAALSAWAYAEAALRHSHDIDVLVAESDRDGAAAALRAAGFAPAEAAPPVSGRKGSGCAVELVHRRGLPVRLRTALFELSCHSSSFEELHACGRTVAFRDRSLRVLGGEDSLGHAVGQAGYSPRRRTLQWACDAWMICARGVQSAERVTATLGRARLLPSASVLLRYLGELGAAVSPSLVEHVSRAASATGSMERDLALHGLRRATPGGFGEAMRRMPDATARLAALGWVLFPSSGYVRWAHHPRHPMLTPLYYVARVARAAFGSPA